MKRGKSQKVSSIKGKRIPCKGCSTSFTSPTHFKHHLQNNHHCKSLSLFCCKYCKYVGFNETGLMQHHSKNERCYFLSEQNDVSTGLLPDTSSSCNIQNDPKKSVSSYRFKRVSADGILDNVQLDLKDDTTEKRGTILKLNSGNMIHKDLNHFMTNSRHIAGVDGKTFPSNFQLGENYNTNDNTFSILNETVVNIDDSTFSDCHIEDDVVSGNESNSVNDIEDLQNDEEAIFVNNDNMLDVVNNNHDTIDLRSQQDLLTKRFSGLSLSKSEEMEIDLFHLLKASNAPLILFDRIIDWVRRHETTLTQNGSTSLTKRKMLLQELNQKLYQNEILMKPRVNNITLSSGRTTNVVTFSIKEMILRMVLNKSLFNPSNILLDPNNPCSPPSDSLYYGEVNSGTWMKSAIAKECSLPNHILMPFCHFIDGLKVDKYGKLTVEAVLTCCLWFNKKARNRSSTWWVQGFVQDQKLFRDQKNYIRNEKAQDYHDMIGYIYSEMKQIRESGGIRLILDFGGNRTYDVIAIPVIQFIIGDCKGNDLLCGRKGGHSLNMNGLCRDCDIKPDDGDNTCIGQELICSYHVKDMFVGKTKEELNEYSFLPINNCFHQLSFGGCDRNIYGATPAEVLHAVLLGLCDYIADGMELTFTPGSMDLISNVVVGIYEDSRRQSERDLPDLGPFRHGLMSVKSLKAKERFSRVYCLFLALSNSYLITELCTKKRKKSHDSSETFLLTQTFLRGYMGVIEQTLLFHLWLKKDNYLKTDFEVNPGEIDSRAMNKVKHYLEMFKGKIIRKGNNLKTPKFHQMLHIVDYIKRHGCPMNYDGSRGENFGKLKIKDNAQLTNKQKETLNFDISRIIS